MRPQEVFSPSEEVDHEEEKITTAREMKKFDVTTLNTYRALRGDIDGYGEKSPYVMKVDNEANTVSISKKTDSGEPGEQLFFSSGADKLEEFYKQAQKMAELRLMTNPPKKGIWH